MPLASVAPAALFPARLNALRIVCQQHLSNRSVIFDLRSDLYSHIQLLPLRWFDNRATGDLMTRVLEDVNSVERMLIDGIEQGRRRCLAGDHRARRDVLRQHRKLALVALAPLPFLAGGRALVHAHRASALSAAAPGVLGHECAAAR